MSGTYDGGQYDGDTYLGASGFDFSPQPAILRWTFPNPLSLFPLVGSARSMAVQIQDPDLAVDVPITFTFAWNAGPGDAYIHGSMEQDIFPSQNRSFPVIIQDPDLDIYGATSILNRTWRGIGGIGYLPSFPQLDRNNTTFPHAN